VLGDLGVVDTLVGVFGDRYGLWGMLDLWRTSGEPYSPAEVELVGSLAPLIAAGLRSSVARTFTDPQPSPAAPGPAVILLGGDLAVLDQTDAAANALLRLNPPDEPMPPIPAAAYNIGAALIADEQGVAVGPIWSRIHLAGNQWLTLRASRLGSAAPEDQKIAVSIEASTSDERLDLFARAHGLSARETEVLSLLASGLDSGEIAATFVLSEHTVYDHVKAILSKTGSRTRQVLISRALGSAQ
jgi:DNA-binding CsgD family transcriptional regulator